MKISLHSDDAFMKCINSGLVERLLKEMDQNDVLVQLNCLQVLGDLAAVEHCLLYLEQQGFIRKIENLLKEGDNNPFFNFLLPGLYNIHLQA